MKIGTIILLIGIGFLILYLCLMSDVIAHQLVHPGPTPAYGIKTGTRLDRVYLGGDGNEGVTMTGFLTVLMAGVIFGAIGIVIARSLGGGCALFLILILFFGIIGLVYMATMP